MLLVACKQYKFLLETLKSKDSGSGDIEMKTRKQTLQLLRLMSINDFMPKLKRSRHVTKKDELYPR